MQTGTIPLIILAGGDRTATRLPEKGADKHPITGLKGFDIQLGGHAMVDVLLERLRPSAAFGPIYIAGPIEVYGEAREEARVIDTDGSFGENVDTSVHEVMKEHPTGPVAFITCDVLPDLEELQLLLEDYRQHRPLAFWYPLILTPTDPEKLGASSWKPQYRIRPDGSKEASGVLPGHLVIVEPSRFRLELVSRVFGLAYKSRNRSIGYRFFYIVSQVLLYVLGQDLRRVLKLRPPTFTITLMFHAIWMSWRLRQGTITASELAERLRQLLIKKDREKSNRGRVALLNAMTLAKDIDTLEEAEEKARELETE